MERDAAVAERPTSSQRGEWIGLAVVIVVAALGYLAWQGVMAGDDNGGRPFGVTEQLEEPPDGISYDGDGDGVVIRMTETSSAADRWLSTYLGGLGFSETATMARIGGTRALDGTVEASSDEARATWTYHPDSGLRVVVSAD